MQRTVHLGNVQKNNNIVVVAHTVLWIEQGMKGMIGIPIYIIAGEYVMKFT